jgi:hypothetical protein
MRGPTIWFGEIRYRIDRKTPSGRIKKGGVQSDWVITRIQDKDDLEGSRTLRQFQKRVGYNPTKTKIFTVVEFIKNKDLGNGAIEKDPKYY